MDAINLARLHLTDTLTAVAFFAFWAASTAACTSFLAGQLAKAGVAAAVSVSAGVTVTFWVATWLRYTRRGGLRTVGSFAMAAVLSGWLSAGLTYAGSFTVPVSTVGCACMATLIVITGLEERRTGSKTGHSLYRCRGAAEKLLYIGITNNIKLRFAQHKDSKSWWPQVVTWEITHYPSRAAALAAERAAIIRERPVFNVQHNQRNPRRRVA